MAGISSRGTSSISGFSKSKKSNICERTVLPLLSCYCCCYGGSTKHKTTFFRRYPITLSVLIILMLVFIGHRIASYKVNRAVLYKHPFNDIVRECPKPEYDVLSSTWTTEENGATNTNDKNRPRICITTLTDSAKAGPIQKLVRWRNFDSLLDMTWPNKQSYCDKHGYILYNESMTLDPSRPPSWSKILAVRRLLTEEQCDWVYWMDADTVIMNSNKRIEDFLPLPDSSADLILSVQKQNSWNAGAWLIRNTPWSIEFLDTWWNKKDFVKPMGLSESGDNAALVDYLRSMDPSYFNEHILEPPRCLFNSVAKFLTKEEKKLLVGPDSVKKLQYYMSSDRYHKTDLVAHIAGVDNKVETTELLLKDAI